MAVLVQSGIRRVAGREWPNSPPSASSQGRPRPLGKRDRRPALAAAHAQTIAARRSLGRVGLAHLSAVGAQRGSQPRPGIRSGRAVRVPVSFRAWRLPKLEAFDIDVEQPRHTFSETARAWRRLGYGARAGRDLASSHPTTFRDGKGGGGRHREDEPDTGRWALSRPGVGF